MTTQVTPTLLAALGTSFQALFKQSFREENIANGLVAQLSMRQPSNSRSNHYNWLGNVPLMTEWLGERTISKILAHDYEIVNKRWANGFTVDRDDLEDDQLGLYRPKIQELALEAVRHKSNLLTDVVVAGTAELCYDGQYFFDTDHVSGDSGSQSNLLTGTMSTPTLAELRVDYVVARTAMRTFKNDNGKPMGVIPTHMMIPPDMEDLALQLLNTSYYPVVTAGPTENVWKGTVELIINEDLTDANDWYLLSLKRPTRPFIFQDRRPVQFTSKTDPTDPAVFHQAKFEYGADGRYNFGYGLWHLAIKTTN